MTAVAVAKAMRYEVHVMNRRSVFSFVPFWWVRWVGSLVIIRRDLRVPAMRKNSGGRTVVRLARQNAVVPIKQERGEISPRPFDGETIPCLRCYQFRLVAGFEHSGRAGGRQDYLVAIDFAAFE